jgi:hypothetical protein
MQIPLRRRPSRLDEALGGGEVVAVGPQIAPDRQRIRQGGIEQRDLDQVLAKLGGAGAATLAVFLAPAAGKHGRVHTQRIHGFPRAVESGESMEAPRDCHVCVRRIFVLIVRAPARP